MFSLKFQTDNAAFHPDPTNEIERILRDVIDAMSYGREGGIIRDSNGNKVGEWDLEFDYTEDDQDNED